jgi:hypothetical protein
MFPKQAVPWIALPTDQDQLLVRHLTAYGQRFIWSEAHRGGDGIWRFSNDGTWVGVRTVVAFIPVPESPVSLSDEAQVKHEWRTGQRYG